MEFPIRLNKYLAHKGYATRREADKLIDAGKILINGHSAVIGQKVQANDKVEVRFKPAKTNKYLAYYKPRGVITHSPAEGETDILMRVHRDYGIKDVFPIGRVDKDSEGLIILTNDGRITERLLSPEAENEKEYEVVVDKRLVPSFKKKMEAGVNIEGYVTKTAKVELKTEKTFLITITEGKKHQIRRMCAALGYQVQKLKRVRIMNVELDNIKPGQYRKIANKQLKEFLDSLGLKN